MKYKLHILSQEYFEQIMQRRNITDSNVEMFKDDFALISICTETLEDAEFLSNIHGTADVHYFRRQHTNVLNIDFWDLIEPVYREETGKTYFPLTDEQAREIVDFVEKNQAKTYLIHCHAGISRSAGVGKFISDHYDWVDTEWFDRDTKDRCYPNATVYGKLKEQFFK